MFSDIMKNVMLELSQKGSIWVADMRHRVAIYAIFLLDNKSESFFIISRSVIKDNSQFSGVGTANILLSV